MTNAECSIPCVTAAIVSYNTRDLLPGCFRALRRQQGVRLEIVFIDNASSDGSVEYVRSHHPEARVVANKKNVGYSAALNQAVDLMSGDYLLALNTDIDLAPDFARRLADCIERHRDERCGYAQGKVLFMTEEGEPTDRFYSAGHLFCLNRLVYNRGSGLRDRGQYDREEQIPGANAACLLMSRRMLEDMRTRIGVFDPLFFMYGGDVDFDWLANLRGWTSWYCPSARAWHIGEASSHISRRGLDAPFVNARFLMMLKNDRLRDVLLDLPRLVKRNAQDIARMSRHNPSLIVRLPAHLLASLLPSLKSRRATRSLRRDPAVEPREWMRWSNRLLDEHNRFVREERRGTDERRKGRNTSQDGCQCDS